MDNYDASRWSDEWPMMVDNMTAAPQDTLAQTTDEGYIADSTGFGYEEIIQHNPITAIILTIQEYYQKDNIEYGTQDFARPHKGMYISEYQDNGASLRESGVPSLQEKQTRQLAPFEPTSFAIIKEARKRIKTTRKNAQEGKFTFSSPQQSSIPSPESPQE